MNSRGLSFVVAAPVVAGALLLGSSSGSQELPPQPPGVEVLARGPVNEAFAQPTDTQPQQGNVITVQPPAPIEELPPDQRPDGDNVQWIPGYWAWDIDSNGYLWVSGCWRAAPPGRRWMPGHWQPVANGWLWVSGFWAAASIQQVQYLPPPPPTLDNGPTAPAPDPTSIYAPGCWVYRESRYMWRPGHWVPYQPHWVWMPAFYVWTPSGCLFVDDYWDHSLDECGLLFAPAVIDLRVWLAARRPFVPEFVIHTDFLLGALFVGPHVRHYYFGDYFDPKFAKLGFVAWTDFHPTRGTFDPHFSYYSHFHAAEPGWGKSLRNLYSARVAGQIPRPPRTLNQQIAALKSINLNKSANVNLRANLNFTAMQNASALVPLRDIHNVRVTGLASISKANVSKVNPTVMKLNPVSKEEHAREVTVSKQLRDSSIQRRDSETKMLIQGGTPVKHTDAPKVVKVTVPKPPPPVVASRPVVRTPPKMVALPKHEVRPIPKYEPPHPPEPKQEKKKI